MKKRIVEIKARIADLDETREGLTKLGASPAGTVHQRDTYFNTPRGRLKLRQAAETEEATLIYYRREDVSGPKRSDVTLLEIPEPSLFQELFEEALGVKAVVTKRREVFNLRGVEVHLDEVDGIGTFLEFEVETDPSEEREDLGERLVELMGELGVRMESLMKGSYSDMES
ncbi:MAG: class IV adenylate cyclase [Candidatus Geothermarchaeales archaeon]